MPESSQFGPLSDLVACCVLAYECGGDDAVDAELARHPKLASRAREQVDALRRAGLLVPPERPVAFGPYRVVRQLGRGGMGTVWLCEQDAPVRRQVAVKVLRPGVADAEMLVRFQLERHTLALLTDPCIARVLDAGVTGDRRPFLVMEYVPGTAITQFCDERRLPLQPRLALFARLCDAVQHAHHKGIVHRDLKPGNVLVVERDGEPLPVVIDFGVAKSVSTPQATMFTIEGKLLGTPEYMSPEQARGEPDVDTRTDVYSLGVVLHELLTGALPIESARLRNLADLGRVLTDTMPPLASARFARLPADERERAALARDTAKGALDRALRREPDWILLRALEKDRNRRYGTAAELALDVRRLLANEAILATPPSRWIAAQRFCARNRLPMTVLATAALLLCALTASSLWFWRDAAAAERTALATSAQLEQSLDGALAALDGMVSLGVEGLRTPESEPMRRSLLSMALELHERLLATTPPSPRLDAALALALARAAQLRHSLGETAEARHLLQSAEARLPATGTVSPAIGDAVVALGQASLLCGTVRSAMGDPEAATVHFRRTLALFGPDHAETAAARIRGPRLEAMVQLADVLTATDVATARDLLVSALPTAQGLVAAGATATFDEQLVALRAIARLAWLNCETSDPAAAHDLVDRVLDALSAQPVRTLSLTQHLAMVPVLRQCASTAIRLRDDAQLSRAVPRLIAILRTAVTAEPTVPSHRRDLAGSLMHHAISHEDDLPPAEMCAVEHEALALFESAATDDDSANTTILFADALLDVCLRRLDWLTREEPYRRLVDFDALQELLQKAEAAHAKLPAAMLQDRHVRETWIGSFRVRAALRHAAGDELGAGQALLAALQFAEDLLEEHPDVVQVRLIAAEIANDIARAAAAPAAAFPRAAGAAKHLAAVAPQFADAQRWPRVWSQLAFTVHTLRAAAAHAPTEVRAAAAADLMVLAQAAAAAGHAADADELRDVAATLGEPAGGH